MIKLTTLVNKEWLTKGFFSDKICSYNGCKCQAAIEVFHHPIPDDQYSCLNHFGLMHIFKEGSALGRLDADLFDKVKNGEIEFTWR
jgi:hypothetical protein